MVPLSGLSSLVRKVLSHVQKYKHEHQAASKARGSGSLPGDQHIFSFFSFVMRNSLDAVCWPHPFYKNIFTLYIFLLLNLSMESCKKKTWLKFEVNSERTQGSAWLLGTWVLATKPWDQGMCVHGLRPQVPKVVGIAASWMTEYRLSYCYWKNNFPRWSRTAHTHDYFSDKVRCSGLFFILILREEVFQFCLRNTIPRGHAPPASVCSYEATLFVQNQKPIGFQNWNSPER